MIGLGDASKVFVLLAATYIECKTIQTLYIHLDSLKTANNEIESDEGLDSDLIRKYSEKIWRPMEGMQQVGRFVQAPEDLCLDRA